jgi:hypothetical protein
VPHIQVVRNRAVCAPVIPAVQQTRLPRLRTQEFSKHVKSATKEQRAEILAKQRGLV